MRLALLSDVHANEPALRAALEAVEQHAVDRILIAGDVVGDGPFPVETVQLLAARPEIDAILGNVDREVIQLLEKKRKKLEARLEKAGRRRSNRIWTALQLGKGERAWLRGLPTQLAFAAEGLEVLVVHGSPLSDTDYVYPSITEEALARKLAPVGEPVPDVLVTGHSHLPFARTVGTMLVVNCGSVGRPADGDPRGSFAVAELTRGNRAHVEIFRFEYPVEEVAAAAEERDAPGVRANDYREGIKS